MSTFNFTVRATDNAGAFADRTFAINVNDTTASSTYDRFLAVGSGGVSRSVDGQTWSATDSMAGMNRVVYGNGIWVAFNTTSGTYRWAPASTMAWSNQSTFAYYADTSGTYPSVGSYSGFDLRFKKGKWTLMSSYYNSPNAVMVNTETTTNDISIPAGWAFQRIVGTTSPASTSASYYASCAFDYDPTSDTWIMMGNNSLFRRQGTGAWTKIGTPSFSTFQSQGGAGDVKFNNGLWIVSTYADNGNLGSFLSSIDGLNFVQRVNVTAVSQLASIPLYQNGRILSLPMIAGSGGNYTVRESTNGGRTFVNRGLFSTSFPQGYTISGVYPPHQVAATSGSTTVWLGPTLNSTILVSTDDFLTFSAKTVSGLSQGYCVASRDS